LHSMLDGGLVRVTTAKAGDRGLLLSGESCSSAVWIAALQLQLAPAVKLLDSRSIFDALHTEDDALKI